MRRFDPIPKYDIGPILEYLGAVMPAYQRQGWQKMRCPFHTDSNPSATVNFFANKFHCFSCGVSEDAIGLLRHAEGTDFETAHGQAQELSGEGDRAVRRAGRGSHVLFGG